MDQAITVAELEKMPQYKKDELSTWVLDGVREFFAQPGVEEDYQRWLVGYRARQNKK